MKFAAKPSSRILVNTGSTQGATGASTGLVPSFTLGCGTWGGSSVSENVSPLHLINIKRVAFGIKDCSTLATSDPEFNYPELAMMAPGSIPAVTSCGTTASSAPAVSADNEKLLKLINELVGAMKEGKLNG